MKTIAVVGMRRSGSTLLFNLIRSLFILNGYELYSTQLQFFDFSKRKDFNVVKVHQYDKEVHEKSDIIFSTIRDLRDCVASDIRFNYSLGSKKRHGVRNKSSEIINFYNKWKDHSDYEFRYEDYKLDGEKIINEVVDLIEQRLDINFKIKDSKSLLDNVNKIIELSKQREGSLAFQSEDLMFPTHITDGNVKSYYNTLSKEEISYIEKTYSSWLKNHNYI